jgi:hypothetical protein
MIACSVCGLKNDEFAITCSSCKSYLQSKVDTLNLFSTIWSLIESPRLAFRKIVLSRHKNYVLLLSSAFGVSLVYAAFWYKGVGAKFSNVLELVGTGLALGPFVGILFSLGLSLILMNSARMFGGGTKLRNMFAVVSYACIPVVFSLAIVFPIEIAVFGLDFFGLNPSPLVISPNVYIALLAFDGLALLWSYLLLVEGMSVLKGLTFWKAIITTLPPAALLGLVALGLRMAS